MLTGTLKKSRAAQITNRLSRSLAFSLCLFTRSSVETREHKQSWRTHFVTWLNENNVRINHTRAYTTRHYGLIFHLATTRGHFSYLVRHEFMGWELNKNQTQQLTHHSNRTEHIHRLWCIWNESLRKRTEKCEVGVFAWLYGPPAGWAHWLTHDKRSIKLDEWTGCL